jgi:hypothetical protein
MQCLSAVFKFRLGAINLAILRIQDFAGLILLAPLNETPYDGHANHRLVPPRTAALIALRIRIFAGLWECLL